MNNMHCMVRGGMGATNTVHCMLRSIHQSPMITQQLSCHINKLVDIVFVTAHVSVLNQPLDLLLNHLL